MTYQCPQCGNTTEQAANFCRKCGAPTPTATLATMPMTAVPTTSMPAVKNADDPFVTWELTAQTAPTAAATKVLSGAEPVTSTITNSAATATIPTAHTNSLPVTDEPPPSVSAPKKSNQGILIGAAAVALLAMVAVGLFFKSRSNTPRIETVAANAVEASPTPNATPAEVAVVETATPMALTEANAATAKSPTPANNSAKATPTVKADAKVTPAASTASSYPTPAPPPAEPVKEKPAENANSLIEQGNRLASAGQLQEAIQAYEKARRASPGNSDIYYLLGSAYHRSGDLTNALEAYRKCTGGNYAAVAANHVKNLEKKLSKKS